MKPKHLPVVDIEVLDSVRVRAEKPRDRSEAVQDYALAYRTRDLNEPIDVFTNGDGRHICADGEHRLLARHLAGFSDIPCKIHEGGEVDALDFALGCNQTHGVRRTDADKYHAYVCIMDTPKLRRKYETDNDIAQKIGVSVRTVARYKARWRDTGKSKSKEKARESAAKHTSEPDTGRLPERIPKTQDQINAEEFFAGLDAMRAAAVQGGAASVWLWNCEDRYDELCYMHEFLAEMIDEIDEAKRLDG